MNTLDQCDSQCINCKNELESPYIVCAVCIVNICTTCFSQGAEFGQHENNHDYTVFNNNFVLFENCKWTAKEELSLLDSLLGNQNFAMAKRVLPQYSEKEIKEHYEYYYVQKNGNDLIPTFSIAFESKSKPRCRPYTMSINNTDDPPRYAQGSIGYEGLAGYNAFRGDFEVEFDHLAEELLSDLYEQDPKDPNYEKITNLQYALFRSYNRRLRKRQHRREVIRNHGLICPRKVHAWLYRYETTLTNKVYKHLIRFASFFTGEAFEKFMEGLHLAGELKSKIASVVISNN